MLKDPKIPLSPLQPVPSLGTLKFREVLLTALQPGQSWVHRYSAGYSAGWSRAETQLHWLVVTASPMVVTTAQ